VGEIVLCTRAAGEPCLPGDCDVPTSCSGTCAMSSVTGVPTETGFSWSLAKTPLINLRSRSALIRLAWFFGVACSTDTVPLQPPRSMMSTRRKPLKPVNGRSRTHYPSQSQHGSCQTIWSPRMGGQRTLGSLIFNCHSSSNVVRTVDLKGPEGRGIRQGQCCCIILPVGKNTPSPPGEQATSFDVSQGSVFFYDPSGHSRQV
jgi:hypothetical protein